VKQTANWTEEYLRQIDDCERRESRLTDWERNFIDSLRRQIEGGRAPTGNQFIAVQELSDGLHLWFVDEKTAQKLARKHGGLPT